MKKYMLFLIILLTVLFISCNNQMSTNSAEYNADLEDEPFLYTDPVKGVVFVDESGAEVVVKTDEESGEVICREVIDYAIIDEGESSVTKSAYKSYGRKKAVVLGYRHDGRPGLWIIYTGGMVKPVVHSEDIETSELLELAEARQPFYKYLGWSYKALDLVVNGDEIVIIGYAEHKDGLKWYKYEIDPGTTVGLYWYVRENDNGYYRISRAKVIGYKDYSWWKKSLKKYEKSGYRYWRWYRQRWLRSLRLFFYGWYDRYLTMPDTVAVGDNDGEYKITGTDDEGADALAIVTGWKVLSIEEAAMSKENRDPYDIIGPKGIQSMPYNNVLEITFDLDDEGSGEKDPDGDDVTFYAEFVEFIPAIGQNIDDITWSWVDDKEGVFSITESGPFSGSGFQVKFRFWTEDPEGSKSTPVEVVFEYYS